MTDEIPNEPYRLFIAIDVPEPVRRHMLRIQQSLRALTPHGAVRWTNPEQFHLTLRFLGDVPSHSLPALEASVRAVCSGASPLHLRAQGVGFFPHARSPRVVWVGIVDQGNHLLDLQKKIENAAQPFMAQSAHEHFAGHVTLGRFKSFNRLNVKALQMEAETLKLHVLGEWKAREIEIVRSQLHETGPRHTRVATLQLGTGIAS